MKQVFKATVIISGATVLCTLVRIVNTKAIAVLLGPSGVGVFYQIIFFSQLLYLATCFGTKMGGAKYFSELRAKNDDESIRSIYMACTASLLLLSLITSSMSFIYAENISQFILSTPQYAKYIRFVAVAIPLAVIMDFNLGILYGFRMVNSLAIFNVAECVLTSVAFLILIYFLGLDGAVISVFTTYSIQLALLIFIIKRYSPIRLFFNIFQWTRIKFSSISNLVRYGSVNLIIVFVRDLVMTILFRRLIILHLGIEANGIYSPAFGISLQMFFMVQTAINSYSFSKISAAKDFSEISTEVNHLLRTFIIIIVPFLFLLIAFRREAVLLQYTDKFLPVATIMPIQFIGDFFKLLVLVISLPIHARADLKGMLFFEISVYIFFYLTASVLIPSSGLIGAGWSYLLLYLFYLIIVTPYVIRKFHLKLEGKNIWIVITSALLLLAASQLHMSFWGLMLASITLLAVWAGATLTREEWKFGLEKSKEYIGKAVLLVKSQ